MDSWNIWDGHNDEKKLDVLKTISTLKMHCKNLNIVLCSREEIEEKIQDIPKDIAEVEIIDHSTGKKNNSIDNENFRLIMVNSLEKCRMKLAKGVKERLCKPGRVLRNR